MSALASETTAVSLVAKSDLVLCRDILRRGSKSFSLASWLLPERVRGPATAVYAFCRVADDAVDADPREARAGLDGMRARLDAVYRGCPADHPADRALSSVVEQHAVPRLYFDALMDGFAWDLEGRAYPTLSSVLDYSARVASSVGCIMTVLMGSRSPEVLARACELGAAMQLTNICRDVGEDARLGRVYLPLEWLDEAQVSPKALLAEPTFSPALGSVVARLLDQADVLYASSRAGIGALPEDCRFAIAAAGRIYADIGRVIRKRDYDSVSTRASTSKLRKLWLLMEARRYRRLSAPEHFAKPLPELAFLAHGTGHA